jgi:hypothetical protein
MLVLVDRRPAMGFLWSRRTRRGVSHTSAGARDRLRITTTTARCRVLGAAPESIELGRDSNSWPPAAERSNGQLNALFCRIADVRLSTMLAVRAVWDCAGSGACLCQSSWGREGPRRTFTMSAVSRGIGVFW